MNGSDSSSDLLIFPCHFEFKAFGPGDEEARFSEQVLAAIACIVQVSPEAMRARPSSAGKYQCVSVLVTLQNRAQLEEIYAALRDIEGLKYLL